MSKLKTYFYLILAAAFSLLVFFTYKPNSTLPTATTPIKSPTFAQQVDTIFFGGDILTVNDKQPTAEAVAVAEGKIIFVGDKAGAMALKTDKTALVDLKGKTLLPGFIDPHTHIMLEAFFTVSPDISPFDNPTIADVVKVLTEASKKGPVLAFGYDPSLMTEPGELGFETLDKISQEVPIVVVNKSGHIVYGNKKAFEQSKITDSTEDPAGGSYGRDKDGHLTGLGYEVPAVMAVTSPMLGLLKFNFADLAKNVANHYSKNGYTTVTDLGMGLNMPTPEEHINILRTTADSPGSPIRIQGYVVYPLITKFEELQKLNNDRFKILGIKIWSDGSIQGYTAAFKERYKDKDTTGVLNFDQDKLNKLVLNVHEKDYQVSVHANGDKAIEYTLNAYENAQKVHPREDPRLRIEHASISNQDLLKRMVAVKATPSFTDEHVYYWGKVFKDKILGEERTNFLDSARTARDLGLKFSFNDDTLADINPLFLIQVAVTRQMKGDGILNPAETITIDDGIKAMTLYAAWQSFRDKELGSIETGKFADFVVLEQNPKKVDTDKIREIKIIETWVDGKKVKN